MRGERLMALLNGTQVNSGSSQNESFSEQNGSKHVQTNSDDILKNSSVLNSDLVSKNVDTSSNNVFAKNASFKSVTSDNIQKSKSSTAAVSKPEPVSINFFNSGKSIKQENLGTKFDTGSSVMMSSPKFNASKQTLENPYTDKNISRKLSEGILPAAYGTQRKTVNSVNVDGRINTGQKLRADYTANYALNVNPFNQGNKIVETQRKKFKTLDFDA